MYQTAPLDRTTRIITIATLLLLGCMIVGFLAMAWQQRLALLLLTAGLLLLILMAVWLLHPLGYSIAPHGLIIRRHWRPVTFPLDSIKSIEIITKKDLDGAYRILGVGGLFGYWGRFANRQLGGMTWYVTNMNNAVLICTADGRKIVVSPVQPEEFAAALQPIAATL